MLPPYSLSLFRDLSNVFYHTASYMVAWFRWIWETLRDLFVFWQKKDAFFVFVAWKLTLFHIDKILFRVLKSCPALLSISIGGCARCSNELFSYDSRNHGVIICEVVTCCFSKMFSQRMCLLVKTIKNKENSCCRTAICKSGYFHICMKLFGRHIHFRIRVFI